MTYSETKNGYIARFFKDEKIMRTLTDFCVEKHITNASCEGIGATKRAIFGYYDLEDRKYVFETFDRLMEVVSMQGNVSLLDGKPFLHVHAAFGDTDLKLYGGHVQEMTVGVTVEVYLTTYDINIERKYDEPTGLNLFELPCQFVKP